MGDFAGELSRLMALRGVGMRELARRVPCNAGHISNLRSGKKRPSRQIALRLDEELAGGGRLAVYAREPVSPGAARPGDGLGGLHRKDFLALGLAQCREAA